jgi:hypothetical protein
MRSVRVIKPLHPAWLENTYTCFLIVVKANWLPKGQVNLSSCHADGCGQNAVGETYWNCSFMGRGRSEADRTIGDRVIGTSGHRVIGKTATALEFALIPVDSRL